VRHQRIRPQSRRRGERQGRQPCDLGRRDAGTDEEERSGNRRCRSKAQAANAAAGQAQQAANTANSAASAAAAKANEVGTKADELDKASKRLVYTVVLSEDEGQFKFGKTTLPDEAKAKLDEMIQKLMANPNGAWFEIEGHTDNVGGKAINEKIGMERAEAVKKYLYEQYQIPLHKINVISYGSEKPVDSNKTKDGRAHNRRVVIRVLA